MKICAGFPFQPECAYCRIAMFLNRRKGRPVRQHIRFYHSKETAKANGSSHCIWPFCRYCNARLLCVGKAQRLVHPCFWRRLHPGFDLWLSPGCLAIRTCRGCLVHSGCSAMVAGKEGLTYQSRFNFDSITARIAASPADCACVLFADMAVCGGFLQLGRTGHKCYQIVI